jgi:hypothetical protein
LYCWFAVDLLHVCSCALCLLESGWSLLRAVLVVVSDFAGAVAAVLAVAAVVVAVVAAAVVVAAVAVVAVGAVVFAVVVVAVVDVAAAVVVDVIVVAATAAIVVVSVVVVDDAVAVAAAVVAGIVTAAAVAVAFTVAVLIRLFVPLPARHVCLAFGFVVWSIRDVLQSGVSATNGRPTCSSAGKLEKAVVARAGIGGCKGGRCIGHSQVASLHWLGSSGKGTSGPL